MSEGGKMEANSDKLNKNTTNCNYSVAFNYTSVYNKVNKSPRTSAVSIEASCVPVGAILFLGGIQWM